MRLDGRRSSSNVEDRRGSKGGKIAGIGGIGGLIITALIIWIAGGNPLEVLNQSGSLVGSPQAVQSSLPPEKEKQYEEFAKVILAGTEDVWKEEFSKAGLTYRNPKM
ncbi:MAG: neutral zinc metallopeptidase, partial [Muribaculaceae bacterium]|nr:neutral zinc metallopeptidase [Muribaculaceae bacterium]